VARVAVESLAGVGQDQLEKRPGAFLHFCQQLHLLPGGQLLEGFPKPLAAHGIDGGDSLAVGLLISPEVPGQLDIDVVDDARLPGAGIAVSGNDLFADRLHGPGFVRGKEAPGTPAPAARAGNGGSGDSRRKPRAEERAAPQHGLPISHSVGYRSFSPQLLLT